VASTVVIVVSVILCGGAKLRAKQKEAQTWYTVGITADNGYTMSEELNARSFAAANVITSASNTAGISEDSAELTAARTALETFDAYLEQMPDTGKMHEMYQANEALDAAIKQLYAKMQELAEDPFKMGAVQGQYGNFNSAGTILSSLHYNEAVAQYEKETGGALASVLKTLQGIKEVEAFA
jgi:cytochrome c556